MAAYRYIACRMCRIFCDGEICSVDFIKAHQLNIMLFMSGICGILQTENLVISIRSEITVREPGGEICAALTGDQCVITEIRIAQ